MPRYDYLCEECGPFVQWLKMNELTDSVACPECQTQSKRLYAAPGLIMTPQALRQRIERGVEPKIVRKQSHSHEGAGCSHSSHTHGGHTHSRSGKRPWMVGH
ncbi:FmdB family zinc ribbon protein [Brevibacillus sp. 179-C 1.1 NHS]|uniref:FmdB family zinc ribbon protein n=1 Tax=Brevibacillus sp. 179-C 1.1 NHS TaxID=3235177 RepID=UPI0039A0782E